MKIFLDTSVILSIFGGFRNGSALPRIFRNQRLNLVSFEKCRYESYLAFRGVGGKKPDEGRGDWARRYLTHEDDPIPLGDSIGKLYSNSLSLFSLVPSSPSFGHFTPLILHPFYTLVGALRRHPQSPTGSEVLALRHHPGRAADRQGSTRIGRGIDCHPRHAAA